MTEFYVGPEKKTINSKLDLKNRNSENLTQGVMFQNGKNRELTRECMIL